jgi:hypothetical protein
MVGKKESLEKIGSGENIVLAVAVIGQVPITQLLEK